MTVLDDHHDDKLRSAPAKHVTRNRPLPPVPWRCPITSPTARCSVRPMQIAQVRTLVLEERRQTCDASRDDEEQHGVDGREIACHETVPGASNPLLLIAVCGCKSAFCIIYFIVPGKSPDLPLHPLNSYCHLVFCSVISCHLR